MKKPTDPLAVLPPIPVEIRVAEQTLSLTPLVLGELPAFAKAISPSRRTSPSNRTGCGFWAVTARP